MDVSKMSNLERSLLSDRQFEHSMTQYWALQTIVTAIFEAVQLLSAGGTSTKTNAALKRYKSSLHPDLVENVEDTAAKAKETLAREHEQGPFQVQALDYGGKPKKKRK